MSKKNSTTNPLVQELSEAELAALMETGEQSAEVLSLDIGQSIRGELIGRGADIEYTKEDVAGDKVTEHLKTWRFKHPSGAVVDILSAHQLEKDLEPLVGQPDVFVMKMEKKDIGGKMVNQFKVINFPSTAKKAS